MKTILPNDYNSPATSPESAVAIAVTDLINTVDTASLHLNGELTKEYLGMLSLYAICRARAMFEDEERFKDYVKLSYECFEPEDEKRARKIYKACKDQYEKLLDLLGSELMNDLQEIC